MSTAREGCGLWLHNINMVITGWCYETRWPPTAVSSWWPNNATGVYNECIIYISNLVSPLSTQ